MPMKGAHWGGSGCARALLLLPLLGFCISEARAQWVIQQSNTTADLRGVKNAGHGVVWASGTGGTVLRTLDDGAHWQKCAIPDAARDGATLDFRGVQAWDDRNAMVMASGPGAKSRLYKTSDGCRTWKLVLKNRDKDGFWDALYFQDRNNGWLLGDPVRGAFSLFRSKDAGRNWNRQHNKGLRASRVSEGAFAASNSSLIGVGDSVIFGTGGTGGAALYSIVDSIICIDDCPENFNLDGGHDVWSRRRAPLGQGTSSSGVFSVGWRPDSQSATAASGVLVLVGGDFVNPNQVRNTCAFKLSSKDQWTVSTNPPHGYRSSVQWSEHLHAWITVGPNGTDVSIDDGCNWRPLTPSSTDSAGADRNWNALSLPFVVGPTGRIGRLREDTLRP